MAGREAVDAELGMGGPAFRRGRFVKGGERRAGGRLGVGEHEERECLLVRSRWEGVEGCQKVMARGKG